jgi:hypothetical protein
VAAAGGGAVVFRGVVTGCEWLDRNGFTIGETEIAGDAAGRFRIWFKNENLMAWRDGEVEVMAPDLICVLAEEDGAPVTNPNCRRGTRVAVVAFPAPGQWRTEEGVAVLGPRSLGFDVDYVPFERRATPGA